MVHAYNNCEQRSRGSSASTVPAWLHACHGGLSCRRAWSRPSRSSRTRMRSRVLRSEHRAWASLLLLTNKAPRSTLTSVSTLAKRQQRAKRRSARAHTLSIEGSSSKRIGKRDGQRCRSCICFLNDISEKLTGKRAEMFRCGPPRFTGTLYCGNVSSRAKKNLHCQQQRMKPQHGTIETNTRLS